MHRLIEKRGTLTYTFDITKMLKNLDIFKYLMYFTWQGL